MRLRGKVAVVTGAGAGMGQAVALRFAREVDAGNLHINWGTQWRADFMPYGGLKDSGLGKEGPRWAVAEMTEEKTIVLHGQPWHPEPATIGP